MEIKEFAGAGLTSQQKTTFFSLIASKIQDHNNEEYKEQTYTKIAFDIGKEMNNKYFSHIHLTLSDLVGIGAVYVENMIR
jgi:hypothetical protein